MKIYLGGAMSIWTMILLLATSCPTSTDAAEAGEIKPMRVMTFNIRYNNPADGANAWPHRRDAVAALIREQQVDIAGLQEARPDQVAELAERLPEYVWYGVGRDDGEAGGEFVPIFYRKDRFQALDRGVFWLSKTPDVPGSKSWDAAITRITTWMELQDRQSNRSFFAFNTHFDHRGQQARAASARVLLTAIANVTRKSSDPQSTAVVVTGDFNCQSDEPPYRILTGALDRPAAGLALADAYQITAEPHQGPLSTWNGFQAIDPGRRIDYIFVSDAVQVRSHRILTDQHQGRFLSDHLPVVADISLQESKSPAQTEK